MKSIAAGAVMVALLAAPAFAQGGRKEENPFTKQEEARKQERETAEKDYNETMKRMRTGGQATGKVDPWAGMRPADPVPEKKR